MMSQLTEDERREILRLKIKQFEAQYEEARLMVIATRAVDPAAAAAHEQAMVNNEKAISALQAEWERAH